MKRISLIVAMLVIALVSVAYAKKHSAPKMTCAEFAAQTPEAQSRVTAFLDGYNSRGKSVAELDSVEVDRQLDTLVVACQQEPKATLWDKIKAKLPGGKKKVKPVAMTCEEFLSLSSDVQPEVAYWLDGYTRKGDVEAAGEVDLERDMAVLVEVCKPTPKAPLWERMKAKL